jgi:hypothetical protein
MQHAIRTLALVAATGLMAGHASAVDALACPVGTTQVTGSALQALVVNRTMCAASSSNSDTWQEYHDPNGDLVDWKLGENHPVDPKSKVGTWTAGSDPNAQLTHTYGSSAFSWLVCQPSTGTSYTLVSTSGASTITGVTIKNGQGACAGLTIFTPGRAVLRR